MCNGQDWTARPEIPAASEIMGSNIGEEDTVDLPPNVVDGPWPSTQEYLRTHYELLREDSVALLRDAVAYVRENPSMTDTSDTCIYDKVSPCLKPASFESSVLTNHGSIHRSTS